MLPNSEYKGNSYADDVNQIYTIKQEIEGMLKFGLIKINSRSQVKWVNKGLDLFNYGEFIELCNLGLLYWDGDVLYVKDPNNEYSTTEWDLDWC
jgi:hypothetical protein